MVTVPNYGVPGYPAPEPRSRPATVTIAAYLLYAIAAIQALNALAVFVNAGTMTDAARVAYAGTNIAGAEGFTTGVFIVGGVINLLIGAGLAVLAIFNNRGKNPARIVTWVVGGLALCCIGGSLSSNALVSSIDTSSTGSGNGSSSEAAVRQIEAALPGWYEPVTTTLTVVALLAILATVILLALPASNEFFRKPAAAGWDPSVPYPQNYPGQYPTQQAPQPYPPYPGQPYSGQQGQPGQPAPGLPPYPGQQQSFGSGPGTLPPSDPFGSGPGTPPPSDPFGSVAPPPGNAPSDPTSSPSSAPPPPDEQQPPKPPA